MKTEEKAFAKINLFLDIKGKLDNGYHEIGSVMHETGLCDTVVIDWSISEDGDTEPRICLSSNDENLPTDERNIAYSACRNYLKESGLSGDVKIFIDKKIPVASGLAGGSADAAATLRGMERLSPKPLGLDRLLEMGLKLGADVPFCIRGGCALAEGLGEKMTDVKRLPNTYLLIARGGDGVSTPYAYSSLDKKFDNCFNYNSESEKKVISALRAGNIKMLADGMFNIFESVILPIHKEAREIKECMVSHNALAAMMSGSGPAVFGIFENENDGKEAVSKLQKMGHRAYLVRENRE